MVTTAPLHARYSQVPLRTHAERVLEDRRRACTWSGVRPADTLYAMNGFYAIIGRADRDPAQLRLILVKTTGDGPVVFHAQRFPSLSAALGFAATYTRAHCDYAYAEQSA